MASKHALEKIVLERILSDPSAQRKYTGGRVKTPSGKYETRLREYIHHHALCKMLTLVTYLDVAKENKILSDVCLFDKESTIKSSNAVLASICRICFARKELIINHMAHLGISVGHVQNPLDEYEYYIKNLSVDLKDGVRLAKLLEILTGRSLLSKMRLPATSRGNKIHNVGEVLSALHEEGVSNIEDVTAAHIVDAHQPRILQLLWNTIMHFQMGMLDERAIAEETRSVGNWIKRKQGGGMLNDYHGVNKPNLPREIKTSSRDRIETLLLTWCQTVCSFYNVPVENFADSFCDGKVLCLLVSFYHPTLLLSRDILPTAADMQSKLKPGVKMNDELVRMALQNERYNLSLALNRINELGGMPRLFSSKEFLLPPDEKSTLLCVSFLFSRLTETNREFAAAREIQHWWQRSLNQRKYEAAEFILNQWRQCKENYFRNQRFKFASSVRVIEEFYTRYEEQLKALAWASAARKKRDESAVQIQVSFIRAHITWVGKSNSFQFILFQSIVRMALQRKLFQSQNNLNRYKAARQIQCRCRMILAKTAAQRLRMHKSCVIIQKNWRSKQIHVAFNFVIKRITAVQSLHRAISCRVQYRRSRKSIISVQSMVRRYIVINRLSKAVSFNFGLRSFFRQYLLWRCNQAGLQEERDVSRVQVRKTTSISDFNFFLQAHYASILQFLFSLLEARGMMDEGAVKHYAALHIQTLYRCHVGRSNFQVMRIAATQIQKISRRYFAQLSFGFKLMDVIIAQSLARRCIAQLNLQRKHAKSIKIQCTWRGYRAKLSRGFCLMYVTKIQSVARKLVAKKLCTRIQSAHKISHIWRGYQARRRYHTTLMSIRSIQGAMRCYLQRISFLKQCTSARTIQSVIRQRLATKLLTLAVESATKIQSMYRACRDRSCILIHQMLAIRIQVMSRRFIAKSLFQRTKMDAAITKARLTCTRYRCAAMTIQRSYRHLTLVRYHAITIQRFWRGYSSRSALWSNLKNAVSYLTQLGVGNNESEVVDDIEAMETGTETVRLIHSDTLLHESRGSTKTAIKDESLIGNHEEGTRPNKSTSCNSPSDEAVDYASYQTRKYFVDSVHDTEVAELENNSQSQYRFYHRDKKTNYSFQDDVTTVCSAQRTISFCANNESDLSKENQSPEVNQQSSRFENASTDQTELGMYYKPQTLRYSSEKADQTTRSPLATPPFASIRANASSSHRGILRNGPNQVQSSSTHLTHIDVKLFGLNNCEESPLEHKSIASSEKKDEDIQSIGVQTRSKRNIFRSLNAAKPTKSDKIFRDHVSSQDDSLSNVFIRSASPDLKSTIKALQIVEKSRLMSELKDAVHTLERTTKSSKECCKYFVKAKGQILLCFLITSCNRSTPHLELINVILQTMTNVAMHRSTAQKLATNEVVEVIINVCQMYRDKAKLFALSSSLLDKVTMNGDRCIMVSRAYLLSLISLLLCCIFLHAIF